jgi:hypothetical protein
MFSEILEKTKEDPKDLNSNLEIMELLNDDYAEAEFFAKLRSNSELTDEMIESLESEFEALDINSEARL